MLDSTEMEWSSPSASKPKNWRPVRFTARVQRSKSTKVEELNTKLNAHMNWVTRAAGDEEEFPSCSKQFRDYCKYTTMHGIRYIADDKRHISEKIFWICWTVFGISAAIYMMSKIYTRWESSPVITSVSNTNYPVTNINFPAVTVCTVNKAVNEKMIIQACHFNLTLSEMKSIISILVDPEARNNDNPPTLHSSVSSRIAMKYLRLVAPKCEDYLLTCHWNSAKANCGALFKLTLTDTGYCCTFNAIQARYRSVEGKREAEVQRSESEYSGLQKAVWDYHDKFRDRHGLPAEDGENTTTTPTTYDAFQCQRTFDDDLFPGICHYLNRCKGSAKSRTDACKVAQPLPTTTPLGGSMTEKHPLKALGAGRSRGLTLMLDTLRCDTVPTDSFKGLRVLVHDPEEFPAVGERGFIVGPGMETQVAVTGTHTFSDEVLRAFNPTRRGCYFSDEFPLKYYKEYSRSSCVLECENQLIFNQCNCVPYYAPGNYSEYKVCSVEKIRNCIRTAITNKGLFGKDEVNEKTCTEFCLPACNETFYNFVVTAATFPNQPEPNMTKIIREAITLDKREQLNDVNYWKHFCPKNLLSRVLHHASITSVPILYKRDELFTWEDFVANLGGTMGLCLGFSLLSLVELIYFFTMRMLISRRKYKVAQDAAEELFYTNGFQY